MKFVLLIALLFSISVVANSQTFTIPCKVLDASDSLLVCEQLGDDTLGQIFSFWYTKRTKARTYPRRGRRIIVYFMDGRNHESGSHVLYDWFLLRR
jgi:hypothetical protein